MITLSIETAAAWQSLWMSQVKLSGRHASAKAGPALLQPSSTTDDSRAGELRRQVEAALERRIPRALTPPPRVAPERMPTGIAAVDSLTGGVPLGCLTEICGPACSGRTSILLAVMAECIRRNDICAIIDANDAFDPQSAGNAGVDLSRLLWVRCRSKHTPAKQAWKKSAQPAKTTSAGVAVEQALKATDLLLQAGGFGLVVLDLSDAPLADVRRIPLTTWFRFRRAVENTATALLVLERHPHAKSCASLVMDLSPQQATWTDAQSVTETPVRPHFGQNGNAAFSVTSEGIAVPFEKPASSFDTPERWSTPHARLLDTLHVHLQVSRTRGLEAVPKKFSAASHPRTATPTNSPALPHQQSALFQ